jgi:23S rRNA (cytidine2498-2'-O)-methyltransferase
MNVALAIYQLEHELERELTYRHIAFHKRDRLYFFDADYRPLFAQVTWINCVTITIASINDGIKQLRALGRNWALFSVDHHRRAQLIQDGLPKINDVPISFLAEQPKHPMGGWTLYDQHTIICSQETTSRYPLGKVAFIENKTVPPSRAYLKLWEFFTVHQQPPAAGSHVLDMGACPGGWSWVLATLGLQVTAVDKAPLEPAIAKMPNITFLQESAFGLEPARIAHVDWFFSDIICYPERLLRLITTWMETGNVKNFMCTIKFQGKADFAVIDKLRAIPGSNMVHLYHNKHELTWWTTQ